MPSRGAELRWPEGGLDRSTAYRAQGPYTTPDCQNVRAFDPIQGRLRGGSRGGLGKAFASALGAPSVVNMLAPLTVVGRDGYTKFEDLFDGETLASHWTAASWLSAAPGITPDDFADVSTTYSSVGAVLDALSPTLDSTSQYSFGVWVAPYHGEHWGTYSLYGRMNDTTPIVTTDGILATLTLDDSTGTFSGTLKAYKATVATSYTFTVTASPLGYAPAGWFEVLVNGNNVSVYFMGNTLINAQSTSSSLGASAGHRIGFGMEATDAGGVQLVDAFRCLYTTSVKKEAPRTYCVAASNGTLYKEGLRDMASVSTSLTIQTDRHIEAVPALQKLYIADYGKPLVVTSCAVSGDQVTITGVTAAAYPAVDCVAVLSAVTGATTAGTYTITTSDTGHIHLTSSPGDGTATVRIERAPKVYDPSAATLSLLTATALKGAVPTGGAHIAYYRGRICIALDHVCYQSRVDDPNDWLYSDTDAEGAVASTAGDGTRGKIGDVFTALIPFREDYLIYGMRNSIYVQRGDLRVGGEIARLTADFGILKHAWCFLPSGGVAFLAQDGLYVMDPTAADEPVNISEDRLPGELQNVNTDQYTVQMGYDFVEDGIHIFLSPNTARDRLHWFVDWKKKAFWPDNLVGNHEPFSLCSYTGDSLRQGALLLGCRDGYIRHFDDTFETDDGTEIASWVKLGAIRPGQGISDGRIDELIATLAENSGAVDWAVYAGEHDEKAVIEGTSSASGTWEAGYNHVERPRVRAGAVVVKLENSTTRRWGMERLVAKLTTLGRQRKG